MLNDMPKINGNPKSNWLEQVRVGYGSWMVRAVCHGSWFFRAIGSW